MKKIYKYYLDCGRMGEVSGVFVEDDENIKKSIGCHIYFGEILGKHSEVTTTLEEDDFTIVTDNQDFIALFEEYRLDNGYNPLDYMDDA